MHFDSVEQILTQLETQPGWEKFRAHRQLLKCWSRVVNQQTAQHTRPLYINRQILYVATSSAARAQELAFQRYTLLKRLNQQQQLILEIKDEIKDIRFSSSQWHQPTYSQETPAALFTISDRQKTKITPDPAPDPAVALKLAKKGAKADNSLNNLSNTISPSEQAKKAAQRWLRGIEQQLATTLACPKCNSVISQAELNRWNLCHHCVAQKWSAEYCPATFPEQE
jgi:predicted nucleic acid-binding Zn ribbon protein